MDFFAQIGQAGPMVGKLGMIETKLNVEPPTFDGQIPSASYKQQFEGATSTKGWPDTGNTNAPTG